MKNLFILFLLVGLVQVSFAQPGSKKGKDNREEHREKIKEWRTAFITDKLDLKEEESIRFWPIYNEREKALHSLRKENRELRPENLDEMTEKEAELAIQKHFDFRQRDLDIHKDCFNKLRKVIPAKKLAKLPHVEREFKRVILGKMKGGGPGDDRGAPGGHDGPPRGEH